MRKFFLVVRVLPIWYKPQVEMFVSHDARLPSAMTTRLPYCSLGTFPETPVLTSRFQPSPHHSISSTSPAMFRTSFGIQMLHRARRRARVKGAARKRLLRDRARLDSI